MDQNTSRSSNLTSASNLGPQSLTTPCIISSGFIHEPTEWNTHCQVARVSGASGVSDLARNGRGEGGGELAILGIELRVKNCDCCSTMS